MGECSTILFINLLKIVSLFCERLILKLYSAKYRSILNSDTQEYIPRIQDFTKNFLFLCVIASTLFSFLFSSYGKFINLNAIIHLCNSLDFIASRTFCIK